MGDSTGMSAADVLALTRGNSSEGWFGGSMGIFALIIIFILLFGGNGGGFWGGNNATVNAIGQSDLQNSLYFQSQDNAMRGLAQGQCALTDTVLNANYNNLIAMKDESQQIANNFANLSNLVISENNATRQMIQDNYIREISDKLQTTRDELSNCRQTAALTAAVQNSTDTILNSQGRYVLNPPCYTNCGCGSLY
jgi:hypothetical protein